ncbi:hypothetical protein [Bradyrhizobium sacchari]|nr:hypothetical protein [Bradyrhizobium sacchari]
MVAKILRDELASIGIQSLTIQESESIAAHIFERISDPELELHMTFPLPRSRLAFAIFLLCSFDTRRASIKRPRGQTSADNDHARGERVEVAVAV